MSVEERIELLKIEHPALHQGPAALRRGRDSPARSEDRQARAAAGGGHGCPKPPSRDLFARPQNNGVTGFVAATGKSYLCEDTTEDPLYLEGCKGAKSSLTVPLVLHDEVIGTFNVESPEPRAFSESDLQFLEIFSRDVAVALNTLELLAAEKANTAQESVEAIHSAVALPVDEILNDAVNVMERYIGHEPEVVERLQAHSAQRPRHQAGDPEGRPEDGARAGACRAGRQIEKRPALRGRRILVVDADESVRSAAHNLLERYGCVVETAHDGGEAVYMVAQHAARWRLRRDHRRHPPARHDRLRTVVASCRRSSIRCRWC